MKAISYFRAAELRMLIGSGSFSSLSITDGEKAEMASVWARTSGSAYREAISVIARKGGTKIASARIADLKKLSAGQGLRPANFLATAPATAEENVEIMSFWAKVSSPICYFTAISSIFLDARDALFSR